MSVKKEKKKKSLNLTPENNVVARLTKFVYLIYP